MGLGNPLPVNLPAECRKAAKIFQSFVSPSNGIDGLIPSRVLQRAHGFAIFTVAKGGFIISARAGTGLVIARLANGSWSAPSAIGTAGVGFGGQAGAEITEFIVVLNSKSAVRSFMAAGSVTLGGNMSIAVGPIGRNAEGTGALNTKGKVAAMYSYSKTKGLFGGVSIEGSVLAEREDCNVKAYGRPVKAWQLLSGNVDVPHFAQPLVEILSSRAGGEPAFDWENDMDQDAPPLSTGTSPSPYEFGGENPLATAGTLPQKKVKSKRGFSIGSSGSGGVRSRSGTLTAAPSVPKPWERVTDRADSEEEEFWRPRPTGDDGTRGSPARGSAATDRALNPFSDPSPSSKRAPRDQFAAGKLQLETTPIVEKDTFDMSSARDALSSESEDDHRRLSFDSFDGSRSYAPAHMPKDGLSSTRSRTEGFPPSSWEVAPQGPPNSALSSRGGDLVPLDDGVPGVPEYYGGGVGGDFTNRSAFKRTNTEGVGGLGKAVGLWDFAGQESGDLSFRKGDVINIIAKSDDQWWTGSIGMRKGIFPLTHVELHTSS